MKKILYLISVVLVILLSGCPLMETTYSLMFWNQSKGEIVLAYSIVTNKDENATSIFTRCIESELKPAEGREVGSDDKSKISRLLKPNQLWYFMVYTKETKREYGDPEIIYQQKKYLQLFAIDGSFPTFSLSYPLPKVDQKYAIVFDSPSGYNKDPNESE